MPRPRKYSDELCEAWVATFKNELADGRRFPSFEHAEHEVLQWIGFYNGETARSTR